jgi:hypothetical protein
VANPTERFAKTGGKALETNEQKMDMADQAGFEPSVPLKSQAEPDLVLPEHLP